MDIKKKYDSIISSVFSAIISKTLTNPLERIKVLQQVQNHYNINHYNSTIGAFKYIIKNEGISSLFKSNLININRVIPNLILRFEFNTYYNKIFVKPYKNPSYLNYLASGVCIGSSQILLTYPIEVIRSLRSLDNNMFKGNTISICCKNIYNNYGVKGFYTGLPISITIGGMYIGTQFSIYNYLKDNHTKNTFIAGAIAGVIAQTLWYSGDSIKRNMHVNIIEPKYKNVLDCIKQLGIKKLYAGYRVNLVKCIIETPMQFYIYENMMKLCETKIDYNFTYR